jgi:hypothetical protein
LSGNSLIPRKQSIKNICYLLTSFPNPSETFISDEAASLITHGITPFVFALRAGDVSVLHPSARQIINADLVTYLKPIARLVAIAAVFKLLLTKPRQALSCFFKSLRMKDRWLYFYGHL